MNIYKFLYGFTLLISFNFCAAQNAAKPTPVSVSKKDTTLIATAKYGSFTNNSKAFATDMKKLLNLDLKVTDNQSNTYTIFSYRLGWRRKEQSDDWRTGKKKTVTNFNAVDINKSSKIPADWQLEMTDNLKAGEEILFEEILAENVKTKRVLKVASLKIILQ